MTHPRFFGYGSLVNLSTHIYPQARKASLKGWRRVWRHTPLREQAFLSIEPHEATTLLGVTADVPNADWNALDEREEGYARHDVSHLVSEPMNTAVYVVKDEHYSTYDRNHPILLSYLDVVVQGYLQQFGPQGAEHLFETTENWAPILDDRKNPLYPRAQKLSDEEREIVDAHLRQL